MASTPQARRQAWIPRALLMIALVCAVLLLITLPNPFSIAVQWLCGLSAAAYVIVLFVMRNRQV
ncbi:hypothetical protein [Dyella sp.]|uniref:hypothetical protein n=1 Tax=Dyella sp. TaxID=1869338 RepID=UPI002ED326AF